MRGVNCRYWRAESAPLKVVQRGGLVQVPAPGMCPSALRMYPTAVVNDASEVIGAPVKSAPQVPVVWSAAAGFETHVWRPVMVAVEDGIEPARPKMRTAFTPSDLRLRILYFGTCLYCNVILDRRKVLDKWYPFVIRRHFTVTHQGGARMRARTDRRYVQNSRSSTVGSEIRLRLCLNQVIQGHGGPAGPLRTEK